MARKVYIVYRKDEHSNGSEGKKTMLGAYRRERDAMACVRDCMARFETMLVDGKRYEINDELQKTFCYPLEGNDCYACTNLTTKTDIYFRYEAVDLY